MLEEFKKIHYLEAPVFYLFTFFASASVLFTQHNIMKFQLCGSCSLSLPHISLYEYTINFIQFGAVMNCASMNILLHII